ncbi:MAG TPA: glycosyltransferase family 2 protein [Clostridiaceae bacterium]|nr:glycosyltransferase family 2 protein [Clostridiaceae bacterium]
MDHSLVSVIIPAYNAERTIERCVHSILLQTYKNIEVLIVDDGSTDKTPDILERLAASDARIRFTKQANSGPGEARNTGIRRAKGEWICFVDSDDYVEEGLVQAYYDAATEHKVDSVAMNLIFETSKGFGVKYPFKPLKGVMTGKEAVIKTFEILPFPSFITNKFFRRDILCTKKIEFPPILYEDVFFVNAYFLECNSVVFLDESYYHYVLRDGSLTSNFTFEHCRDYLTSINLLCYYIAEKGEWDYWKDYISKYVDRVLFQMRFSLLLMNKDMTKKERDKLLHLIRLKAEELKEKPNLAEHPYDLFLELNWLIEEKGLDDRNELDDVFGLDWFKKEHISDEP